MSAKDTPERLSPCPFCGGACAFHEDETDCIAGCHWIVCSKCRGMFDLGDAADPENTHETLEELRVMIAPVWNRRSLQ